MSRTALLRSRTLSLFFLLPGLVFILPAPAQTVQDLAVSAQFQGDYTGAFTRGRALVAADFDLDGDLDFFSGNPGDHSFILRQDRRNGRFGFFVHQILTVDELSWGAAAADYDNDGDYDLYVSCGANEGECYDHLFQNMLMEEGLLRFEDVTETAGIKGPVPDGETDPIPVASANGVWGDYDRDGDVDLFVSVNIWKGTIMDGPLSQHPEDRPLAGEVADILGRNVLWENNGDGTFTDVTVARGLHLTQRPTRHSTFLDIDNDGDLDLYENNNTDLNVLWRNLLVETGEPVFEDVTAAFSPPGEDLQFPYGSFVSCAADFDNDGWEDIIAFVNNDRETVNGSPYGSGHAYFLNQEGAGFVNVADEVEINNPHIPDLGVMGSMVGDLNGDATPDVYIGNGGPSKGQFDQLFLSDNRPGMMPHYANRSDLIDFPAPVNPRSRADYPPYPYRTHGTNFVDIDGNGTLEIAVTNGGPAELPDWVREPNRLFKFTWPSPINYVRIRPVGDGVHVSKDAVGTRLRLTVRSPRGDTWNIHRTLYAGQCFSAQNGFALHVLIGPATVIEEAQITWPDGTVDTLTEGLTINADLVVTYAGTAGARVAADTPSPYSHLSAEATFTGEAPLEAPSMAGGYELSPLFPNPFATRTSFALRVAETQHVRIDLFDLTGRRIQQVYDGTLEAFTARAFDLAATDLPSGVYLLRVTGERFTATRRAVLLH